MCMQKYTHVYIQTCIYTYLLYTRAIYISNCCYEWSYVVFKLVSMPLLDFEECKQYDNPSDSPFLHPFLTVII